MWSLIGSKQLLTTHQHLVRDPVPETTEQSQHSPVIDELQVVSLTFVNDLDVPEVQVQDIQQQDEYETDSDTERDDEVEFQVISKTGREEQYVHLCILQMAGLA